MPRACPEPCRDRAPSVPVRSTPPSVASDGGETARLSRGAVRTGGAGAVRRLIPDRSCRAAHRARSVDGAQNCQAELFFTIRSCRELRDVLHSRREFDAHRARAELVLQTFGCILASVRPGRASGTRDRSSFRSDRLSCEGALPASANPGQTPHPESQEIERPFNETDRSRVANGVIPAEEWLATRQAEVLRAAAALAATWFEQPADEPDRTLPAEFGDRDASGHRLPAITPQKPDIGSPHRPVVGASGGTVRVRPRSNSRADNARRCHAESPGRPDSAARARRSTACSSRGPRRRRAPAPRPR